LAGVIQTQNSFRPAGKFLTAYVHPLAKIPAIAGALRLGARVTAISRFGMDKVTTNGRAERPFENHNVEQEMAT
jgi:hypothetical protein